MNDQKAYILAKTLSIYGSALELGQEGANGNVFQPTIY